VLDTGIAFRKAGTVRPSGKLVVERLRGNARSNVFAANVEMGDRGAGLVTAPSQGEANEERGSGPS
jgi:hypothetical protein